MKGASFLDIRSDGVIAGIHDNAMLWAGMPYVPVAGTIEGTAALLESLDEGQDAWFWMSDIGGGGTPAATAVRVDDDPTGRAFRGQVRAIRGDGKAFSGVLRPLDAGRLAMTTTGDLDTGVRIVKSLLAAHNNVLSCLQGARLVRMAGGRFVAAKTIAPAGPDLSSQVAMLNAMAGGAKAVFWFTSASKTGQPILVLAEDPGKLKAAAKQVQGKDKGMRGQVRMTGKGWLEFRTRKTINDFIPTLAKWAMDNHGSWDGLSQLRGARLTVRDEDDQIVSRHKDDAVWSALG